jgi:DNA-binding response OmpR family regulator
MAKVLIVEDQPSVATVVQYHVEQAGFETTQAGDVEEAWRKLVTEVPDAAVVDIKLPGADGWTFIERVRADGRFSNLPMVVLTGLLEADIVARAESLRCAYLSKPFAASALVNKIESQVKGIAPTKPTLDDLHQAHMVRQGNQGGQEQQTSQPPAPSSQGGHVDLVSVRVVMLLPSYQIEGNMHLPPELGRFSDAWESLIKDSRHFLPVTDAIITVLGGPKAVARAAFLQVRKTDVSGVFPKES